MSYKIYYPRVFQDETYFNSVNTFVCACKLARCQILLEDSKGTQRKIRDVISAFQELRRRLEFYKWRLKSINSFNTRQNTNFFSFRFLKSSLGIYPQSFPFLTSFLILGKHLFSLFQTPHNEL